MSHVPALSKKFFTKRNAALYVAVPSAIILLISSIGSIADSTGRKKKLEDFQSGLGAPPEPSTADTELLYAFMQLASLLGFGIAIFFLIENPFHLK